MDIGSGNVGGRLVAAATDTQSSIGPQPGRGGFLDLGKPDSATDLTGRRNPRDAVTSVNVRSAQHHSARLAAGSRIGSYRIDKFLDRGGMASVYLAVDLRLNRRVALKILDPELARGTDLRRRFLRESRFAAALDHPNIVPVYEASQADGLLYIAMRYVRGHNLDVLLADRGALAPSHALTILTPIADALDAAHAVGLIHRDIKPANILIAIPNGRVDSPHAYLSDFGVTTRTSGLSKLTATGNFIGTLAYTAPEQIRGEQLDARTDLYALACVTYKCLTGHLPFDREHQAALLSAHLLEQPGPMSGRRSGLEWADPIVAKALAKDAAERFGSCGEFLAALTAALPVQGPIDPREALADVTVAEEPELGSVRQPVPRSAFVPGSGSRHRRLGSTITVVVLAAIVLMTAVFFAAGLSATAESATAEPELAAPPVSPSAAASPPKTTIPPKVSPDPALAIPTVDGPPITVPGRPEDVAIAPDGRLAYIADSSSRSVRVLDLSTGVGIAVIPVAIGAPRFLTITPDGSHAYVSVFNDEQTVNVIVVLDLHALTVIRTIPVDRAPYAAAISPDGQFAYVPSHLAHVVTVIDIAAGQIVQRIDVPPRPYSVVFAPDGETAYLANRDSNVVTVLDTASRTVKDTVSVCSGPHRIAIPPQGRQLAVACVDSAEVYFLDPTTTAVTGIVAVGAGPQGLQYSPDGRFLYSANQDANTVSVIDAQTMIITAEIPSATPSSVAVLPNGRGAYVTNADDGTLTVLTTA